MLLLKRWLKDNEPHLKPEQLPDSDPAAVNELLLQVMRYYHSERIVLLKCIQVVMLKAGEPDEAGGLLEELLSRLVTSGLEEQLHGRLRENLEAGAAAITRRLKEAAGAAAGGGAAAALGTALGAPPPAAAGAGALTAAAAGAAGSMATLTWLSAAHGEMRGQLLAERLELLNCLLLLHEVCGVAAKPERAQALARLLLDRVFPSKAGHHGHGGGAAANGSAVPPPYNGGGAGGGDAAALPASSDPNDPAQLCQQLAGLLLLSCLDLPGHVRLANAAAPPPTPPSAPPTFGAPAAAPPGLAGGGAGAVEALLPLGGRTVDVHNQISQYAAGPGSALLLLAWAGCLRLMDGAYAAAGAPPGSSSMVRDLDGAARELEARVAAVGGLGAAAGALAALCGGGAAVGALLLVYRGVGTKALCVLCTAFDLGVDAVDGATYDTVEQLLALCVAGDARACGELWDDGNAATAPLRALLAAAARLFPAAPRHLLRLLRATAAAADSARAAYGFLQRHVALVVLHDAGEPAIRHLGGGEVELAAPLPWNLAPSVPGLELPQGCIGTLCPLPAPLAELRGRRVLVSWDADVSGGGGQSRGQVLLLGRASHCVAALEHCLHHHQPLTHHNDPGLLSDLADTLALLAELTELEPGLTPDLLQQSVTFGPRGHHHHSHHGQQAAAAATRSWTDVVAGVLALGPQLAARMAAEGIGSSNGSSSSAGAGSSGVSALQLLSDAAKLLGAVAAAAPGRVLALLPLLPLFSSPDGGAGLLSGLPASVPLEALAAFTVPAGIDAFCGLLPVLSGLSAGLEAPAGRYPLTRGLLDLLAGLLERGWCGAAPLPAAALWVLHELLPAHHAWRYAAPEERWRLTASALRLLRLAVTAGAFATDPDLSQVTVEALPSAAPPAPPAAAAAGALVPYGGGVSGAVAAAAAAGAGIRGGGGGGAGGGGGGGAFASLTPEQLLAAAAPRLHVSPLSAALLKLLLLHGGVLLARCMPPPAEELERLRAEDASRPELPALEAAAAELVALVPPALAAACAHGQEQPLEEWLLAGGDPPPAAHVASYIAYHEGDRDASQPESQLSYLALRALLSIAACVSRPVGRSLPGVSLALAVPSHSGAEACLRQLLAAPDAAAAAHPRHYALAAALAAEAVACHAKLLDALMFPSPLEEEVLGGGGAGGAAHQHQHQQHGGAVVARKAGGGGGAGRVPKTALDGCYVALQHAARFKREAPQVLAAALRLAAALWQQPAAAARALAVLRRSRDVWAGLEAALAPVGGYSAAGAAALPAPGGGADGSGPLEGPDAPLGGVDAVEQRWLCEAYALHILTAEAVARARSTAGGGAAAAGGSNGGAAAAPAGGSGAEPLLDRLVREGTLLRLLQAAVAPAGVVGGGGGGGGPAVVVPDVAAAVGLLQRAAAALYLEMGAGAVAGLWPPHSHGAHGAQGGLGAQEQEPDSVSLAPEIRQELSGVKALLASGGAHLYDIQAVHDDLVNGAVAGAAALSSHGGGAAAGSPGGASSPSLGGGAGGGGGGGMEDPTLVLGLPPSHPLAQLLSRQALGAALVSRCNTSAELLAPQPQATAALSAFAASLSSASAASGYAASLSAAAYGAATAAMAPCAFAGAADGCLLSRRRLGALLGPAADTLQAADLTALALSHVSSACAVAEAKLAALQAAAGLAAVLARDGRLTPAPGSPGAAAALLDPPPAPASSASSLAPGGVLATAAAVSAAAVGSLLHWCSSPEGRAASQAPDWGLRRLHAHRLAAAMAASRLLLAAVQAARPALLGGGAGGASGAAAAGGFATPARTPGLGGVFGTPQTRRHRGNGQSGGGGGGGGAAADAAFLPLVVSLARQVAGWARVVAAAGLPQCPAVVVGQVTDALGGALLLTLQMLPAAGADGGAGTAGGLESEAAATDRQQLSSALLSMLPQLCELAAAGGLSPPLAAQLLLESTRHLATHEWLPPLMAHIDLGRHILEAAGRAAAIAAGGAAAVTAAAATAGGQSAAVAALLALRGGDAAAAAGDVGMLALALAVAQVPEGAQALNDRGILDQVVAAGRHLLAAGGGRLAAFNVIAVTGTGPYRPGVDGTYASTSGAAASLAAAAADTCGAYLVPSDGGGGGGGVWSPVHRQWCTLLQFSGALLRTLGQYVDVEREALDLLLALEPRLLLAVLPPGGDCLQPLTLAGLVELEAALFLLGRLAPYLGGWHLVLPASLVNFRTALSTLLTWLAAPSLSKSFAVDCRPRTAREAALAALPAAGMPAADGWFRVATAGAAAPPAGGAATFAYAAAAAAAAAGGGGGGGTPGGGGNGGGGGGLGSPITGVAALGSTSPSIRFSMSRGMSDTLGNFSTPSTPPAGGGGGGGGGAAGAGGFATPLPASRAASGLGGAAGAAAATPGGGGGRRVSDTNPAAGAATPVCSEYSAQVAEKLYACAHHALSFLAASSPQLSEGEASSLGPAWPRPRDLAALLEQCRAAAETLTNYQPAAAGGGGDDGAGPFTPSLFGGASAGASAGAGSGGGSGGGAGAARRAAAVRTLSRVGQMCAQFLSVLGQAALPHAQPPPPGAAGAHLPHAHHHHPQHHHYHHLHAGLGQREAAAQEWLASLELSGGLGMGTPAVPAS
ncbi:hypothetical protein HXX76_001806 [Chlamydomonas incerta]|uniref:Uncharacterized protein n=1 Tax=Chlamydomonas incerta TaxID=51695 RepID=A0A835TMK1_CHLIN|nr:hypothetical protein HXX76_001806 [Chlamydomonas incerta]|eukprot:KAG2443449.1 hypothetical protein HXX76_001806 [Chlamydomonas incerta]